MASPKDILIKWASQLSADRSLAHSIGTRFGLSIEGEGGGHWTLLSQSGRLLEEGRCDGDCVLICDAENFVGMAEGALNPQEAFLSGRLRIGGNYLSALKLYPFFCNGNEKDGSSYGA